MVVRIARLFLVSLAALSAIGLHAGAPNENIELREIEEAWERALHEPEHFHCRAITTGEGTNSAGLEQTKETTTTCYRLNGSRLRQVDFADNAPAQVSSASAFCWNEDRSYAFRVQKHAGSPNSSWLLSKWTPTRPGATDANALSMLMQQSKCDLCHVLYTIEHVRIDDLVNREEAQSVSVSSQGNSLHELTISFPELSMERRSKSTCPLVQAGAKRVVATVDEAFDYCIQSASVEYWPSAGIVRSNCRDDYRRDEDGRVVPVSTSGELQLTDGSRISGSTTFEQFDCAPTIDPERLTIEYYGIDMPASKAPGSYRTPAWLYYFVGGVLTVIVGAFFVHRATKARA